MSSNNTNIKATIAHFKRLLKASKNSIAISTPLGQDTSYLENLLPEYQENIDLLERQLKEKE